jgi:hypothetical protein
MDRLARERSPQSPEVERRRVPRQAVLDAVVTKVRTSVPVKIVDVSPFGAQIETGVPLRPATECSISLQLGDATVRLRALVMRCRASIAGGRGKASEESGLRYLAGLEFVHVGEVEAAALARMSRASS